MMMPWEAWMTVAVVVLLVVALARSWAPPDALMMGALTLVMLVGTITDSERLPGAKESVLGFGNSGPVTVGLLFAVVAGLVHTGALQVVSRRLLGQPKTTRGAQARLIAPVWLSSAFLNNTPIVAMFLPVVTDLARRTRISPSKLFIPLSYASILGGICTLIGTSTNLVVNGLLVEEGVVSESLPLFEIAWLGIPCALVGVTFLLIAGKWLLPDRASTLGDAGESRQYTAELQVDQDGPLVGKTITDAGLRHLPGLFLASLERRGLVIPAVDPSTVLEGGDRLEFAGDVESVIELRKTRGLSPLEETAGDSTREPRMLVDVVVSSACPVVGETIRGGRFRTRYDAAVVALARDGRRIHGKLGDQVLKAGDTLVLEARRSFVRRYRNSSELFFASVPSSAELPRHDKSATALLILLTMVVLAGVGVVDMLTAAACGAGAMMLTGCCSVDQARRSVDWPVLIVIGGALGLGQALDRSGAAHAVAETVTGLASGHAWLSLFLIYLVTTLFTEVITNNAAVALVFPIAVATAESLGVSPMPFVMVLMIAGSASFATPIGYQTNLMVSGPGGYSYTDFLKIGLPMNLLMMAVSVTLAPLIWPF